MNGIDYTAAANAGLEGVAFGFFFFGVFYLLMRMLLTEVLASPVVQALARAAQDFHDIAGKGGKGDGGWKAVAARGGMKILGKLFGVEDAHKD